MIDYQAMTHEETTCTLKTNQN